MKKEKWKRTREWINYIEPPNFDKVAGYSSILGLILTIISLFSAEIEKSLEHGLLYFVLRIVEEVWIPFLWIWGIVFLVWLVSMVLKYRNSVIIKMNASSLGLSYIMDKTTEVIDKMENIEDDIGLVQDKDCPNCAAGKTVYRILLNTVFVEYIIVVLNKLCDIFEGYVSYPISACLKLVVEQQNEVGEEEPHVVTLARNSESDEIRNTRKMKPVPISSNTDFANIINGSKNGNMSSNAAYFYEGNLKKYAEEIDKVSNGEYKYLNSNSDWDQYYIGTIVVPVGLVLPSQNGKQYNVWGFLCVDSLSPKAFTKSQKTINIKLLQGFASIISIAVGIYQKKINIYK